MCALYIHTYIHTHIYIYMHMHTWLRMYDCTCILTHTQPIAHCLFTYRHCAPRYIEESVRRFGKRYDHAERLRKKKAREPHKV